MFRPLEKRDKFTYLLTYDITGLHNALSTCEWMWNYCCNTSSIRRLLLHYG